MNPTIAGKQSTIKQVNKSLIISTLKNQGEMTAPDIAKTVQLSLPTVTKLINELLEDTTIRLIGVADSTGGRRANIYDINNEKTYIIVFLQNDKIQISAAKLSGEIVRKEKYDVKFTEKRDIVKTVCNMIGIFIDELKAPEIDLIGIGVPGIVDRQNKIYSIPTLIELDKSNIKETIEARFNIKVVLDRDVVFSSIGAYNTMLKKKYSDIVYIFFSKGIGLGAIIENRLYRGVHNASGDIGYMVTQNELEDFDWDTIEGYKNRQEGLFERKVENSIKKIIDKYGLQNEDDVKMLDFSEPKSCKEKNCLVRSVAYSIINALSFYDPEAVVVEGRFINQQLLDRVKQYINRYLDMENRKTEFFLAEEENMNIYGAINYCFLEANGARQLTNELFL